MLHLLAQLPQVALDAKAPMLPAPPYVAPDGVASFDAKLAQAISGGDIGPEPAAPQAESAPPSLPDQPAQRAIASILAELGANASKTVATSSDVAPIQRIEPESEVSGGGGADPISQQPAPRPDQPQPQTVVQVSLAQPQPQPQLQPTVVAVHAAPSPNISKTEIVRLGAAQARQARSETLPVEQHVGVTQMLPLRPPLQQQSEQKKPVLIESAALDTKAQPTEMPVGTVSANTSIMDVSINRASEPGLTPRMLDLSCRDWAERVSNEIIAAPRNDSELVFRLTPQHLGTLEIGLTETRQGMIVELQASKEEAAQIIARDEPRLLEELRQRGVPVAEVSLRNGAGDDGRNPRNGANPAPQPPLIMNGPQGHDDQDQQQTRERGRLA
jgi:flagellar hook-length control protein FliK